MIRPLMNCVLLKMLPKDRSEGGVVLIKHTNTPEEEQQANHKPTPPDPIVGEVMAIGAWPSVKNRPELKIPPPFPAGAKVLIREGAGEKLTWEKSGDFRLVAVPDCLAQITS